MHRFMKIRLLYTITATLLFQLIPSRPLTHDMIDHETVYCYWHLKYHKIN